MNDETKEVLDIMKELFSDLKSDIKGLSGKVDSLDNRLSKVELSIEKEIRPAIQLLAEGQQSMATRLVRVENKVDALEGKVDTLSTDMQIVKSVVTTHSSQLQKLDKAN